MIAGRPPPWPYPPYVPPVGVSEPQWACPSGDCTCHPPHAEGETVEHKVFFFDHAAERMPGARCQIIEGGKVINNGEAAGPDGSLVVNIAPTTQTLFVEWAPNDLPEGPRFPYRKIYHVKHAHELEPRVESRLHNIGFSARLTLRENVIDFQQAYDLDPTGVAADIDEDLRAFHDDGTLPPVGKGGGVKAAFAPTKAKQSAFLPKDPPAQSGAPQSPGQGSAAAIQTTKVRIKLMRAFTLFKDDFEQFDDVTWEGEQSDNHEHRYGTYDAHKLWAELLSKTYRLGPNPIQDALITASEPSSDAIAEAKTDANGVAVFNIPTTPPDSLVIAFTVEPPDGQLNTTRLPAGPELTDENTTALFLYRPFTLLVKLDASGAVVGDEAVAIPNDNPRFAKVIQVDPKDNTIEVDWRPDWMRTGPKKNKAERLLDPVDTPINPFDLTLPEDDRRRRAPPVILIHGTATHNMPAIGGHLADSGETGSHYWVDFDGFVIKMVDEYYKTNHAGTSLWTQRASVNQFSVGIETMHLDQERPQKSKEDKPKATPRRFTKEQYAALIRLCKELQKAYPVLRRHVIGHTDQYIVGATSKGPGVRSRVTDGTMQRRGCPGEYFEWERLENAGVAVKPFFPLTEPPFGTGKILYPAVSDLYWSLETIPQNTKGKPTKSETVRRLKVLLFDIGYSVSKTLVPRDSLTDEYDGPMFEAVRAFQQHHFSGRRRRYQLFGAKGAELKWPPMGSIDPPTIRAIVEKWWAVQDDPI